jgi:hypothetical protein
MSSASLPLFVLTSCKITVELEKFGYFACEEKGRETTRVSLLFGRASQKS